METQEKLSEYLCAKFKHNGLEDELKLINWSIEELRSKVWRLFENESPDHELLKYFITCQLNAIRDRLLAF